MGMSAPRKGQRESPNPPGFGKELNLPALLDIQWPKCFQLQGGFALWPGALPLDPAGGSAPKTPELAMVPPQPLIPSVAYGPPLEKNLCAPLVRGGNRKEEREGEGWKGAGGRKRGERYGMGRNFPPWLSSRHLGRRLWCQVLAPVVHVKKIIRHLS